MANGARSIPKPGSVTSPGFGVLLDNWRHVMMAGNLPKDRAMDGVSRWLFIVRACVFPMTLTSACIGGLLAALTPGVTPHWGYFALCCAGLTLAHATNNMINDLFDTIGGVDSAGYVRTQYAPHPLFSNLISKRGLIATIIVCNVLDLAIMLTLVEGRGWGIAAFALAGLFISVFYVAPPLKLKHHGLGEPGVFVVWGPLMIGGTYYATAGMIPAWVWWASVPYAISTTTVLIGKHVDKYDQDKAKGIHTLPVIMGTAASLRLNQAMMIAFYPIILALVATGSLGVGVLLVAAAIPRLLQVLKMHNEPKPASPPPGYRLWPLWYVSIAFYHNRLAGGLFVLGLLVNLAFGL
jgi:1,4-dihydroxy-2-naphthoate polyprenyltransferase